MAYQGTSRVNILQERGTAAEYDITQHTDMLMEYPMWPGNNMDQKIKHTTYNRRVTIIICNLDIQNH